jgi:hypothetical protein
MLCTAKVTIVLLMLLTIVVTVFKQLHNKHAQPPSAEQLSALIADYKNSRPSLSTTILR